MADTNQATWSDMTTCLAAHQQIEESAIGLLRTLSLDQKRKLLEKMGAWADKLKAGQG